jgi:hypothetical protein
MDNVQNCDSYTNIPSSQTCKFYLPSLSLYTQEIPFNLPNPSSSTMTLGLTQPNINEY